MPVMKAETKSPVPCARIAKIKNRIPIKEECKTQKGNLSLRKKDFLFNIISATDSIFKLNNDLNRNSSVNPVL